MISIGDSLLSTIAALAATLLALSLLIQVMQEVWKYLTNSQATAYQQTLTDFLGPWARQILEPGTAMDLKVRGPLQFRKITPPERLLPLDRDDLVDALERTLSPWHREMLSTLKREAAHQARLKPAGGAAALSPDFEALRQRLGEASPGSAGHQATRDILTFLNERLVPASEDAPHLDATQALEAFRIRFMPHIVRARNHYSQLMRNFEHAYRRRNLRQTFTFAFLLALAFDLPFGRLYHEARSIPADEAFAMLASASAVYDTTAQTGAAAVPREALPPSVRAYADSLLVRAARRDSVAMATSGDPLDYASLIGSGWNNLVRQGVGHSAEYLVGALITALLLSFGAPLWNDIAKSVLRLKKGPASITETAEGNT